MRVILWTLVLIIPFALAGVIAINIFHVEAVQDLALYLCIVFGHWQAYATGGGVTALLLVYERLAKPLTKQVFIWIVIIAFLLEASFSAWHDAYLSMKGREADLHAKEGELRTAQYAALRTLPTTTTVNVAPPVINIQPVIPSPTGPAKPKANVQFLVPIVHNRPGEQFWANVACHNEGDYPTQIACHGQVFLLPLTAGKVDVRTQELCWVKFRGAFKDESSGPFIGKDNGVWGTSFGPILTDPLYKLLNGGDMAILVTGLLLYWDDFGKHTTESCLWLQPPLNTVNPVWHLCDGHNQIVK